MTQEEAMGKGHRMKGNWREVPLTSADEESQLLPGDLSKFPRVRAHPPPQVQANTQGCDAPTTSTPFLSLWASKKRPKFENRNIKYQESLGTLLQKRVHFPTNRRQSELPPALDRFGANEGGFGVLIRGAHSQRVAVGEVVGNIGGIGERNVRALPREADVVALIGELMWQQAGSGFFAATDSGEEHGSSENWYRLGA